MAERKGEYVVTEGTDATGKTTVANRLAELAYAEGHEVIRWDEPDSPYAFQPGQKNPEPLSPISSEIRRIIKDGSLGRVALANVHLFTASRVDSWENVAWPALQRGAWVIAARNYLSTTVYQGYAEGLNPNDIVGITRSSLGAEYMSPDHLNILDLENEAERAERIVQRGILDTPDTFESRNADFQRRLIDGYRTIAQDNGINVVSAAGSKESVAQEIWTRIQSDIASRDA